MKNVRTTPISAGTPVRALLAAADDRWILSCTKGVSACIALRTDQPSEQLSKSFAVDGSFEYSPLYTLELHRNSWQLLSGRREDLFFEKNGIKSTE
ncbi:MULTISPECIES: hypothetical protein [Stenotrophomonas]|uniref:hypothetical protein n=1 Tax=Stenotrophomonas TaxID=40323 RepID=UPI0018D435BC|nr:hypothetical protein [Stenotrophomonas sp.]MBH1509006.1 hypothetical protein [Stenotrophomonas maltophilia]